VALVIMKSGARNRRSLQACVSCHDRKVRCDYSVSGAPCTNCRLDYRECVVRARGKRRSSQYVCFIHLLFFVFFPDFSRHKSSNCPSIARVVTSISSDTAYTAYSFIDPIERSDLLAEDVLFLQMKGCLNVPTSKFLRLFIEAYFARVHPLLPVLDEARFPRINASEGRHSGTISLFVLHSLLFASCSVRIHFHR
jgi:hypothetical protein